MCTPPSTARSAIELIETALRIVKTIKVLKEFLPEEEKASDIWSSADAHGVWEAVAKLLKSCLELHSLPNGGTPTGTDQGAAEEGEEA